MTPTEGRREKEEKQANKSTKGSTGNKQRVCNRARDTNTFPSKGEDLMVECVLLTADPPDTHTQKSESENGNPPGRRSLKASWRPSSQQTKQERPAQASRATTRNKV